MKNITNFTKCLTDETRLRILRLLSKQEMCVCEMVEVLRVPQARISQHLLRLRNEGLVEYSREGQWVIYSLNAKALRKKMKGLKKFFFADPEKDGIMAEEFARLASLERRTFMSEKTDRQEPPEEALADKPYA